MTKKGGRPSWKPTKPQREQVMRLRADGWSKERIARLLGTDHETLEKHFKNELDHGADIKTNALLEYAENAAKRGSQASIKWLSERFDAARAAEQLAARASQPTSEQAAPVRAPALGKKEQRQQAADGVTGLYEPPPPPIPKVH